MVMHSENLSRFFISKYHPEFSVGLWNKIIIMKKNNMSNMADFGTLP